MNVTGGVRGSGRTMAMVKNLPDTGSIVIVHSENMCRYITEMIRDIRGRDVLKVTRVKVCNKDQTGKSAFFGTKLPVFIDHDFFEQGDVESVREVSRLSQHDHHRNRMRG
jgi:hypothetical protein